jgi:alpha-ketoglutarate-dependent taurine dioxygenase
MRSEQDLSVRPIAGALGAELEGVRLAHLNEAAFAAVQAAFLQHQVLFFRNQEITRDQQRGFAPWFGTLNIHPFEQPLKDDGYPEFVVFQSDLQYHPMSRKRGMPTLRTCPKHRWVRCCDASSHRRLAATRCGRAWMRLVRRFPTRCSVCYLG